MTSGGGRDDYEPQRVFGIPIDRRPGRPFVEDTEQRVLGVPARLIPQPPEQVVALVHPLLWMRWRRRVRRGLTTASFVDYQQQLARNARVWNSGAASAESPHRP